MKDDISQASNDLIGIDGQADVICPDIKKWTDADMETFAEWCSESLYNYHKKHKVWVSYGMYRKVTTAQLREMWENENKKSVS